MEWEHKKIIITIESDGKFHFSINGEVYARNTLEEAKSKINEIFKYYYTFDVRDINKLCEKLDKREAEFVRVLLKSLNSMNTMHFVK